MRSLMFFFLVTSIASAATHTLKLKFNDSGESTATVQASDAEKVESIELAFGKQHSLWTARTQSEFTGCQNFNNGALSSKEALVVLKLKDGYKPETLLRDTGAKSMDRQSLVVNYGIFYGSAGCVGSPIYHSVTAMTLSPAHHFNDQP